MNATQSYYVETGPMQDTDLDRELRFATRGEAEQALKTLLSFRTRAGDFTPEVMESTEAPTTTIEAWNER